MTADIGDTVEYRANIARRERVPKASSIVADEFRMRIALGEWRYGESIGSEAELVENSGFSRPTVREALRLLEAEGLLVVKRGAKGGISLARPDLTQVTRSMAFLLTLEQIPVRALLQFRKLVGPAAARLSAENASDEQRATLIGLTQQAGRQGYQDEAEFHDLIAHSTGNQLLNMLLVVPQELLRLHLQAQAFRHGDVEEAQAAHARIAEAIAEGKGVQAERLMHSHLESFEDVMRAENRLDDPVVAREQWETVLHRGI